MTQDNSRPDPTIIVPLDEGDEGDKGNESDDGQALSEHRIRRYSAYFPGWCLAFGDHELRDDLDDRFTWLFGDSRVGLILHPSVRRPLFKALLGHPDRPPEVTISHTGARFNTLDFTFQGEPEMDGVRKFLEFIVGLDETHMFLTNHFCYPSGTKILTFSPKRPPIILYKDITPLTLKIRV